MKRTGNPKELTGDEDPWQEIAIRAWEDASEGDCVKMMSRTDFRLFLAIRDAVVPSILTNQPAPPRLRAFGDTKATRTAIYDHVLQAA